MPADGWPVVDLRARHRRRLSRASSTTARASDAAKVTDDSGNVIAQHGDDLASTRCCTARAIPAGTNADLAFFNFLNLLARARQPEAGRARRLQLRAPRQEHRRRSGADDRRADQVRPDRIYFKGHSQGALTGALFLAAEPEVKAAILSGAGGGAHPDAAQQDRAGRHPFVDRQRCCAIRSTSTTRSSASCRRISRTPTRPTTAATTSKSRPPASRPRTSIQSLGIIDTYTPVPNDQGAGAGDGRRSPSTP